MENKYNIEESFWIRLNDEGKLLFNYMYGLIDDKPDWFFATDIFRLDLLKNEEIVTVYKIMNAAKFNISLMAAQFISGEEMDRDSKSIIVGK